MTRHRHSSISHHNEFDERISGSNLLAAIILNFAITAAEFIGGLLSNSLALLSDALHNLSDGVAVLIAYIAYRIGKRETTLKNTFGFKRIEILAAFINSVVLIGICIFLFIEAYQRFLNPMPIKGVLMLTVAVIGLVANLIAVILLKKDKQKNINIKAAYLHLLGDTFSSVAVIIGGVLIYWMEIYWLDPLLTVLICLYIIKETYSILRDSLDILMQSAPRDVDMNQIQESISAIEGIHNIHHAHIWMMDDKNIHFECHIELDCDRKISETNSIRERIEALLHEQFDINHITLQIEYDSEHKKDIIFAKSECC
jgi:cobalt-zinc-cadmium efflux system protein